MKARADLHVALPRNQFNDELTEPVALNLRNMVSVNFNKPPVEALLLTIQHKTIPGLKV